MQWMVDIGPWNNEFMTIINQIIICWVWMITIELLDVLHSLSLKFNNTMEVIVSIETIKKEDFGSH